MDSPSRQWQLLWMFFLVAAAAAFSAPVPVYQDSWINSALDFPQKGVTPNTLNTIALAITVNPNGYVERCQTYFVIGNPNMGPYTCQLIQLRALFQPARDLSGRKTFGVYRQRVSWWTGKAKPPTGDYPEWDFVIPVSIVPADLKLPAVHRIKFAVDSAGNVSRCAADSAAEELGAPACAQLVRRFKIEPARTRSGKTVPSIQNVAVRYVREEEAK